MRNNAGMTLVEVLVAMAIAFIIFLGITNAGLVVLDQNIKNFQRDEAVNLADNVMNRVRNTPLTGIAALTSPEDVYRPVRGINQKYTVTITDNALDVTNHSVTVNVAWTRTEYGLPRQYSHTIMSIVRQR